MPFDIQDWEDIQGAFVGGTILLGNGASIAVDTRFSYTGIIDSAIGDGLLSEDVERIFKFFQTEDFELILRLVWQATNVNRSLGIEDNKSEEAYSHIRDTLISAVRHIHPEHEEISSQLPVIYEFLKHFDMVISLNYDLIVYWVMMYGVGITDRYVFKDCFLNSDFEADWQRFSDPIRDQKHCPLVFYPHGNLVLARDKTEQERKLSSKDAGLLEGILSKWEEGSFVPLFVCEGTTEQKIKSIHGSHYLNTVFREVLPNLASPLVIYGWNLGEHDIHILHRMATSGIEKIAVSVLDNDQAYCTRVDQMLRDQKGNTCDVVFFDSQSDGCWNRGS